MDDSLDEMIPRASPRCPATGRRMMRRNGLVRTLITWKRSYDCIWQRDMYPCAHRGMFFADCPACCRSLASLGEEIADDGNPERAKYNARSAQRCTSRDPPQPEKMRVERAGGGCDAVRLPDGFGAGRDGCDTVLLPVGFGARASTPLVGLPTLSRRRYQIGGTTDALTMSSSRRIRSTRRAASPRCPASSRVELPACIVVNMTATCSLPPSLFPCPSIWNVSCSI